MPPPHTPPKHTPLTRSNIPPHQTPPQPIHLPLQRANLLPLLAQLALGAARRQLAVALGLLQLLDGAEEFVGAVARARDVVGELRVLLVAPVDLRLQVLDDAVDVADGALGL